MAHLSNIRYKRNCPLCRQSSKKYTEFVQGTLFLKQSNHFERKKKLAKFVSDCETKCILVDLRQHTNFFCHALCVIICTVFFYFKRFKLVAWLSLNLKFVKYDERWNPSYCCKYSNHLLWLPAGEFPNLLTEWAIR